MIGRIIAGATALLLLSMRAKNREQVRQKYEQCRAAGKPLPKYDPKSWEEWWQNQFIEEDRPGRAPGWVVLLVVLACAGVCWLVGRSIVSNP